MDAGALKLASSALGRIGLIHFGIIVNHSALMQQMTISSFGRPS